MKPPSLMPLGDTSKHVQRICLFGVMKANPQYVGLMHPDKKQTSPAPFSNTFTSKL